MLLKVMTVITSSSILALSLSFTSFSSKRPLAFSIPVRHEILMRNNTIMTICGKGSIDIDDSTFHDVFYVPSFSSNLLSIYQITHSGIGKIVEFAEDSVHIKDSEIGNIVAIGIVDHASNLYSFLDFGPPSSLSETLFFHESLLR